MKIFSTKDNQDIQFWSDVDSEHHWLSLPEGLKFTIYKEDKKILTNMINGSYGLPNAEE